MPAERVRKVSPASAPDTSAALRNGASFRRERRVANSKEVKGSSLSMVVPNKIMYGLIAQRAPRKNTRFSSSCRPINHRRYSQRVSGMPAQQRNMQMGKLPG